MNILKQFKPIFDNSKEYKYRYLVYYGGRGGGKTENIASSLLLLATITKIRVLCARHIQRSIQDSVHKTLKDIINSDEVLTRNYTITDHAITSSNGSEFIFKGLWNNTTSIKSMANIDICWVEEAHSISTTSWDILDPTIRNKNSYIILSFNPDRDDDVIYDRFIKNENNNALVTKINFDDNPYFPEDLDKIRLSDFKSPEVYNHKWLGEVATISEAQIFKGKYTIAPVTINNDDFLMYGMDFGFSQDPTTVIGCFIRGNSLYIFRDSGAVGVEINHIYKHLDLVLQDKKAVVTADSARPETISYLRQKGYNVTACKKWAGSIADGIEYLKSFDAIVIDPRCTETIKEFSRYSYKVDERSGLVTDIVIDANNHYIDALRYAVVRVPKTKFKATTRSAY